MLTTKQKKFIPEYLKTGSIKTACKKVGITENTYQNWRDDAEFMAELKKQEDLLYNISIDKLKNALPDAIDTLKELLKDEASNIKLRASCAIIDNSVKLIDNKELQERIEALEVATEEKRN